MERVIILPEVFQKLEELIEILYEKDYFGFRQSAIDYAVGIYDYMATIPRQKQRTTRNKKYGAWYCQYRHRRGSKTIWYITFDTNNETYLIKNIINNHTREYPIYIRGRK